MQPYQYPYRTQCPVSTIKMHLLIGDGDRCCIDFIRSSTVKINSHQIVKCDSMLINKFDDGGKKNESNKSWTNGVATKYKNKCDIAFILYMESIELSRYTKNSLRLNEDISESNVENVIHIAYSTRTRQKKKKARKIEGTLGIGKNIEWRINLKLKCKKITRFALKCYLSTFQFTTFLFIPFSLFKCSDHL